MSNYFNKKKFQQLKGVSQVFTIEDIKKDFQMIKFFLAIYTNDFAFKWQLEKQHNLTSSQIQRYSEKLNEFGLISFRLLSELSENMVEAIMSITPDFEKIYNQNPKVYVITPFGKTEGKKIIVDILKKSQENQGLYDLVQRLLNWSSNFRKIKKQILNEEKTQLTRKVKFPNGVIIEKYTNNYINLLKYIKVLKYETTSGKNLILKDNKQELKLIEEVKQDLNNQKYNYKGVYSHLTNTELNDLLDPVTDKDVKELRKEERKEAKERLKEMKVNKDWEYMCHYEEMDEREKKQIYDEGLDFLNGLIK